MCVPVLWREMDSSERAAIECVLLLGILVGNGRERTCTAAVAQAASPRDVPRHVRAQGVGAGGRQEEPLGCVC